LDVAAKETAGKDTAAEPPPSVQVQHLRKTFRLGFTRRKLFTALDDVSFSIHKGRIVGFLGPNGAGKTTTIKILTGLIFADEGEVQILGGKPTDAEIRQRIGYLPENPSFHDHLTGREVLGFACDLLRVSRKLAKQRSEEALAQVQLSHSADLQVRRYSKGMTQRLGIAQALVHDPEMLILDEPMSGLDPVARHDVKDLLRKLVAQKKTIFFSTHIIADVEDICDHVTMVVGGKIVRDAEVGELVGAGTGEMEIVATQVPAALAEGARSTSASGLVTFIAPDGEAARELVTKLWNAGGKVLSMNLRRHRLEDHFLQEYKRSPNQKKAEEAA